MPIFIPHEHLCPLTDTELTLLEGTLRRHRPSFCSKGSPVRAAVVSRTAGQKQGPQCLSDPGIGWDGGDGGCSNCWGAYRNIL